MELDRKNCDTLWADVIAKLLNAVEVAHRMLEDDETNPNGY